MSENIPFNFLTYIFRGTDCTFIFPGSDDGYVEIHANRFVIDKASDYLKAKFETYKRNTLIIQDVSQSIFKMVLEWVSSGSYFYNALFFIAWTTSGLFLGMFTQVFYQKNLHKICCFKCTKQH